jgi:hypothetical protein
MIPFSKRSDVELIGDVALSVLGPRSPMHNPFGRLKIASAKDTVPELPGHNDFRTIMI